MSEPVKVGDKVTLPKRYGLLAGLWGEVTEIEDGWAMVECGSWGIFGMPADKVRDDDWDPHAG